MPPINDRDSVEARLARVLGKANRETLNRITELLGDPPDLTDLTPTVWEEIKSEYTKVLYPEMERIFVNAAEAMTSYVGGGVEWDLINKRAADWARQYTYDLVSNLTSNSRTTVQSAVGDFYDERLTIGGLQERLTRTFGAVRAESIAITETTRAAAEGERAYAMELEKQGASLRGRIITSNDDFVCSICSPKQGKDPENEGYPPYHPRCRCGVAYEVVLPESV